MSFTRLPVTLDVIQPKIWLGYGPILRFCTLDFAIFLVILFNSFHVHDEFHPKSFFDRNNSLHGGVWI